VTSPRLLKEIYFQAYLKDPLRFALAQRPMARAEAHGSPSNLPMRTPHLQPRTGRTQLLSFDRIVAMWFQTFNTVGNGTLRIEEA
jgi:hypothetical protein